MHPNLSKNCPLHNRETSSRMNITQTALLFGTWAALFAIGFALLP